jgi:4-amino-4-deoxy-L-arabinose transferase-like glycosyltransferase
VDPKARRGVLAAMVCVGAAAWLALALSSPTLYGWVYDPYYQGIMWSYEHGGPPPAEACWVCAHPPLFFLAGLPLYALGRLITGHPMRALRFVAVLSLLSAAVVVLSTDRLLRLFRVRGAERLAGTGLALAFPCLAFAAGGPEADVLLAGIMAAFLYRLARYHVRGRRATWRDAVALGALGGLGLLTKYSAVPGLLAAGAVIGVRVVRGPARWRWVAHGLLVVAVAAAIAGWRYSDNLRRHGALFYANGSAREGFLLDRARSHARAWDFGSLSLRPVLDLYRPDSGSMMLTDYPVYHEVWSSLHAQAWSDMSFFSVRGRYGAGAYQPYRTRRTWLPLVALTLGAGLYPTALAALGFLAMLRRRTVWPLALFVALTWAAYLWWVIGQEQWALKTKYLLFLLPAYVLFATMGLRALRSRAPRPLGVAALAAFASVAVVAEAYVWMFIVT